MSAPAGAIIPAIPIPQSRFWTSASRRVGSSTPRSSGCTPAAAGPRAPCGSATAAISCGATSRTIAFSKWEEETGQVSIFRRPSDFANGNTRDRQGRLITCEHGARRVTRTEYDGTITVLMDRWQGKRLNSPNDVVVKSDGSIWFTDPPFGLLGQYEGHKAEPELPQAVYRIDGVTGEPAVVAHDILGPNGLCFSPDERILYVVESRGMPHRHILAYDVKGDGRAIANRRVLIDAGPGGTPDGMRCDIDGNLWCGWGMGNAALDGVPCSRPTAPKSAASRCPSAARTSASAAKSAIACSWPRASRCTSSTSTPRARPGG